MRALFPLFLLFTAFTVRAQPHQLPGTSPLTFQGDIASNIVAEIDQFLLQKLQRAAEARSHAWRNPLADPSRKAELTCLLGINDPVSTNVTLRTVVQPNGNAEPLASTADYLVQEVEWNAFANVRGSGLMAIPRKAAVARAIVIPDAANTPEQLFGLQPGLPPLEQTARILAENGCVVVVPVIIDRTVQKRGHAQLPNREYLYRPSFTLGRTLIGYELAKIEALFRSFPGPGSNYLRIGITGSGEGGLLSLYAGAFSSFDVTMVSGYFGPRHRVWEEPIDRNIFGLLENFGDAEIGALVLPRSLLIEPRPVPELVVGGNGAAPGRISNASSDEINQEFQRLLGYAQKMNSPVLPLKVPAGVEAIQTFFQRLTRRETPLRVAQAPAQLHRPLPDSTARMNVQISELEQHNEGLLADSAAVRTRFMKGLDFSSLSNYVESARGYREYFATNIIGRFDDPRLTLNPRTRLAYEGSNWLGYEVVLDVFTNVTAYGILLLPKDLKPGERRPVVVCQHGLEGRPQELIKGDHPAYHDYAARLAEEGFITFSPQNLYLFKDRFRTLQRKANPLKKTLFSIITPQHEAILTWLKTLPQVDPARIGFYGLSYGGKTAMRVPALLEDYAFSICSADFNEWVWKNASTRSPYSYVGTGEYEIFEWNLAQTFNYAEMAALIAPRPFMVERGHFDNVAPDEMVAHEYAKVRHLYAVNLRIPERTEIEWFVGPHTINGKGTFDFARRHLQWPPPR